MLELERVERIELSNSPWQGLRLPLHHTRITFIYSANCAYSKLYYKY